MSRISQFRNDEPDAYFRLKSQLDQGNRLKSFGITFLYELGRSAFFKGLPVLGDLIKTSEGLLAGHISDSQLATDSTSFFSTESITRDSAVLPSLLEVDILIIGSGPGAAIAAEVELSRSSSRICVLERGTVQRTPEKLHHTLTHVINDFYQAGQELVLAKGFPLYAQASVIGGGSEVNSGLFHNLPEIYREKWVRAFDTDLRHWLEAEAHTRSMLEPEKMNVSAENSLLARGARKESLVCENIPRWRTYDKDGSYVHRGMSLLFWDKKHVNENLFLCENSEAVHIENSNPEYIEVKVKNLKDNSISTIRTKKIHLAGGAISTPVLLMKSKLIRWRDTSFAWHPMVRIVAKSNPGDLGAGDIDPFQAWTKNRELKFGSAVSTAPLLSVALGRLVSPEEASTLRSYYVSFSSTGRGGITPFLGLPWYKFSKEDIALAQEGLSLLKRVITQGGGKIVNEDKISHKKFSTVHIFGTLPITSSIYIKGSNQLKRDPRIHVSDASILPFGPGVNPQGVVMTSVRVANLGSNNE